MYRYLHDRALSTRWILDATPYTIVAHAKRLEQIAADIDRDAAEAENREFDAAARAKADRVFTLDDVQPGRRYVVADAAYADDRVRTFVHTPGRRTVLAVLPNSDVAYEWNSPGAAVNWFNERQAGYRKVAS